MAPQMIGRYEIKAELGRGGMATVFRGYDPRFMREVAIKVLPREFLHDPSFRARFTNEARAIAALEHSAIVPVYDFGEEGDQPYLVMRLMTGGSLADRISREPLSVSAAARILNRFASGLDRAHSRGIIHRDLKPGNILFDDEDQPYISDFGIAKITEASTVYTRSGGIVGTPAYMSPEQARGDRNIDGRSDTYALGAILFEMLTGHLPYDADTPMGLAVKHITEPPPRILESRPDLPPDCDDLILKAMAKRPAERFESAAAMARALDAIARETTASGPMPAAPAKPSPKPYNLPTVKGGEEFSAPDKSAIDEIARHTTEIADVEEARIDSQVNRDAPAPVASIQPAPVSADAKNSVETRKPDRRPAPEPARPRTPAQPPKGSPWPLRIAIGGVGLVAVVGLTFLAVFALIRQPGAGSATQSPQPEPTLASRPAAAENTNTAPANLSGTLASPTEAPTQPPPSPTPIFVGEPHPILGDVRVRQGIAHCTDRDALIESVYPWIGNAGLLRLDTWIPKDSWANYDGSEIVKYSFSPAKGQALFEEAGWTRPYGETYRVNAAGEELALKFTTTDAQFRQTWAAVFEEQMKDCGLRVLRNHVPASWWFGETSGLRRRDFELGAYAWVGQTDPGGETLYACDQIPTPDNDWSGQNYMGWCNPVAHENILRANTSLNRRERLEAYKQVQIEFTKDMVSLPLFSRALVNAADAQLVNFKPNPTDNYTWNAHEWSLPNSSSLILGSDEPSSLDPLIGNSFAATLIGKLIFDQGYTSLDYDYQSVLYSLSTVESGLAEINPVTAQGGEDVIDAAGNLTELQSGVTVLDSTGQPTPFTGSRITMNQLVVTYQFKRNVKWSDGEPVVKADFQLAYKHDCDRDSGAGDYSWCDAIQEINFLSDTEYVVTYKPGYQNPLYFLAPLNFYPSHQALSNGRKLSAVPAADWAALPEIAETPLGVGPYVVKRWTKGASLTLEANPFYWRGANSLRIKTITVKFIGDVDQAVSQLIAGTIDIAGWEILGTGSQIQTLMDAERQGAIQVVAGPSPTWEHIDMNVTLLP